MFQNFKADIIYYNTPTDFELEFNLCGCCRMRLLNDKCSDKKSLLTSLSRAFSRSRVTILCAPLFDGENIIKTVAVAIGTTAQEVDCGKYGIGGSEPIEIINGSTPLVTSDGIFGGCIIESGPQTLIILTDNKGVRKTIMQTLIHPYIEEISKPKIDSTPDNEFSDHSKIITEQDPREPDEDEPIADELENMLLTDGQPDTDQADISEVVSQAEELFLESEKDADIKVEPYDYAEDDGLFTETEKQKNTHSNSKAPEEQDYYDDGGYYIEETDHEKSSAFNISLLIISIILLVAIAVLCFCIFFIPAQSGTDPAAYLQEIFNVMFK